MSVTIDNSGSSIEIKNNGALLVTMSGTQGPAGPPGDPADNTDWGDIGGTLSDQTDLQAALDLKADDSDLTAHTSDTDIHFGDAPSDGSQYARKDGAWEEVAVSNLQDAYDLSSIPQILTNAGALTLRNGGAGDTDDVFAIQDIVGTNTFSLTGEGGVTAGDLTLTGDINMTDGSQVVVSGGAGMLTVDGNLELTGDLSMDDGSRVIVPDGGSMEFVNSAGSRACLWQFDGNIELYRQNGDRGAYLGAQVGGGAPRVFLGYNGFVALSNTSGGNEAFLNRQATGHFGIGTTATGTNGTLELADIIASGDITLSDGSQIVNTGETVIDTDFLQINLGGGIAARIDTSNGNGFMDFNMSNTPFFRVVQSTGKFSRLSPFGFEAGASGQSADLYVGRLANGNCGIGVSNNQSNNGTLELADIIASGDIDFTGLPTSDPASAGRLWSDSGNVRVSGQDSDEGNGFADYNNTDSPTTIPANTWVTIPNDGLGAFSNSTYIPEGITRLMDTSTGEFDFSELALGDSVLIRNDFSVNPDTNNALLEMRYQLGTGGSAYTLETVMGRLDDGSGKDYRFALKPDLIYMGDSNTRDNPVTLQIRLSTSGTVSNAGSVIQLIRK